MLQRRTALALSLVVAIALVFFAGYAGAQDTAAESAALPHTVDVGVTGFANKRPVIAGGLPQGVSVRRTRRIRARRSHTVRLRRDRVRELQSADRTAPGQHPRISAAAHRRRDVDRHDAARQRADRLRHHFNADGHIGRSRTARALCRSSGEKHTPHHAHRRSVLLARRRTGVVEYHGSFANCGAQASGAHSRRRAAAAGRSRLLRALARKNRGLGRFDQVDARDTRRWSVRRDRAVLRFGEQQSRIRVLDHCQP